MPRSCHRSDSLGLCLPVRRGRARTRATPSVRVPRPRSRAAGSTASAARASSSASCCPPIRARNRPWPGNTTSSPSSMRPCRSGASRARRWSTGDLVIVQPGGGRGSVVAFDKTTGEHRWSAGDNPPSYSSPVAATIGGRRIDLRVHRRRALAIRADDGAVTSQLSVADDAQTPTSPRRSSSTSTSSSRRGTGWAAPVARRAKRRRGGTGRGLRPPQAAGPAEPSPVERLQGPASLRLRRQRAGI